MKDYVSVLVIVPIFNTEKYIGKCLESLTSQTFDDWHAVLVNDGSTDHSEKICREYEGRYPDKFTFLSKEHGGPGSARNFGIETDTKKSKYLYFLDSDDYLEKDALEKLFGAAETSGAEIAVCGYKVHNGMASEIFRYKDGVIGREEACRSILENECIGNFVWNKLFSYTLFENLRFPTDCLYEDVVTTYRAIFECKSIAVVSAVLYNYVRHGGSIVSSNNFESLNDLYRANIQRSEAVVDKYPELKEYADINELRIDIYIWNQICRKNIDPIGLECPNLLSYIKESKHLYPNLSLKYRIMAHLINSCPQVYGKALYMYGKLSSLNQ